MSASERRGSPRKECVVPLRFRVVTNDHQSQLDGLRADYENIASKTTIAQATLEGEVQNLSERGMYFTSREKLSVGAPLEMYLTLPRELTGRTPEQVRCSARVVHVEESTDLRGARGIGAVVNRFEAMGASRDWSN